jgi:REP element-mobilizing transposase RayT
MQVRRQYHFVVVGYVVMPEHIHLLITEPEIEILQNHASSEAAHRVSLRATRQTCCKTPGHPSCYDFRFSAMCHSTPAGSLR